MAHFIIDETKCRRDGICAAVCPVGIIEHAKDGLPQPAPGAAELCISCGHCVAVCPHGAFALATLAPESCPPVRPEWRLDPDHAEHFLRSRRSIRAYKEQEVGQGRLERLIRIARHAPSGHNGQPVRWTVVSGPAAVRVLGAHVADWMRGLLVARPEAGRRMLLDRVVAGWDAGRDPICRHAPHLVLAHAPKADVTAPGSCMLALAYLELAAPSLGLGACWAGYLMMAAAHHPPLQEALALPAGHALSGAMLVGEPKFRYHRLPARREPEIDWR